MANFQKQAQVKQVRSNWKEVKYIQYMLFLRGFYIQENKMLKNGEMTLLFIEKGKLCSGFFNIANMSFNVFTTKKTRNLQ